MVGVGGGRQQRARVSHAFWNSLTGIEDQV
jgi:hypothetical protein